MKFNISFEGEMYEDDETMKIILHATDMYSAMHDARQRIRSRLKYEENVSDEEEKVLEELREILWIDGLDL